MSDITYMKYVASIMLILFIIVLVSDILKCKQEKELKEVLKMHIPSLCLGIVIGTGIMALITILIISLNNR